MKLSTAAQMREMDGKAIEAGIPDVVLMENASIKSFYALRDRLGSFEGKLVVAFVGAGNNGGDALAISRHLHNAGANVFIYILTKREKLGGSPEINYNIVKNMGIEHRFVNSEDDFNFELIQEADIIVDGIFGTGLSREVGGLFRHAIELINTSPAFVLAVDIPSGIKADTGEVMGVAVEADLTVTFAMAKPGHILYPGRGYTEELEVVDISTPRTVIEDFSPDYIAIDKDELVLKEREATSHKGTFGHLAIVGGSTGKSGAVIMASKAAVRCGVGLVSAVVPRSINTAFEAQILEAMSYPVAELGGMFDSSAIEDILAFVKDKSAVCFGMGLGVSDATIRIAKEVLKIDKSLLIDADGINALAGEAELLRARRAPTIITPHPKEFSRLIGVPVKEILENRLDLVKEFARKNGVILVLKMADTLVGSPDGRIYINTTGNPGLATGGSGDVLSGMIGAFLAQGYEPIESALNGVYLHGLAADIAIDEGMTYESLSPVDLLDYIDKAIGETFYSSLDDAFEEVL